MSLRYLAPPAAVLGVSAGLVVGVFWPWAWLVPATYVVGIGVGSLVTGRDLPSAARVRLPGVYATMHGAWGTGFLSASASLWFTYSAFFLL